VTLDCSRIADTVHDSRFACIVNTCCLLAAASVPGASHYARARLRRLRELDAVCCVPREVCTVLLLRVVRRCVCAS